MKHKFLAVPFLLFFLLALASPAFGQLVSTGNEQVVQFLSPPSVNLLSNSPVNPNLLSGTGTNEFILSTQGLPNSVASVFITNDTANPCNNLTISFGTTGANITSFNNSPGFWQPLGFQPTQATAAGFVSSSGAITLPANATVKITTLTIAAKSLMIQLPLSSACPTTNIDVNIFFSNPIILTGPSGPKIGQATVTPFAVVSDVFAQSYAASVLSASPAASAELGGIHNAASTSKNIYFDRLVVSTSSTTPIQVTVQLTTGLGTGCTTGTVSASNGAKINVSVPSIATQVSSCTTPPGGVSFVSRDLVVSNSTPFVLDLKGFIATANTTSGIDVINTANAITGNVSVDLYWNEF